MKVTLKINQKLVDGIKQLKSSKLEIGWFEGTSYDDGLPVAQVAYWQEYGTTRDGKKFIPPRPFLRNTVSDKRKDWKDHLEKDLEKVVQGNMELEQALNRLGTEATADIKESIAEFSNPPNAPATIKKKGFNDPLVDTGTMLLTVSHRTEIK